jgi:hypothetical protein
MFAFLAAHRAEVFPDADYADLFALPGVGRPSLVYWRNRIARSGRPHRVNDAVRKVIEETGVLKGRRRRAVPLSRCSSLQDQDETGSLAAHVDAISGKPGPMAEDGRRRP